MERHRFQSECGLGRGEGRSAAGSRGRRTSPRGRQAAPETAWRPGCIRGSLRGGLGPPWEPGGGRGHLGGCVPGDSSFCPETQGEGSCVSMSPGQAPARRWGQRSARSAASSRAQMAGSCSPEGSIAGRRQRSRSGPFCRRRLSAPRDRRPAGSTLGSRNRALQGLARGNLHLGLVNNHPSYQFSLSHGKWCFFRAVCRAPLRSGRARVVASAGGTHPGMHRWDGWAGRRGAAPPGCAL